MLAKTLSCGLSGVYGYPVEVEAFISSGMIGFEIVGLPSAAVKESRDRVRAAISVSGLSFPFGKVTVNLAPADVKKEGTAFELAIAVALLAARSPEAFCGLGDTMLLGELALDGRLMPVRGALGMAITAARQGVRALILPRANARECECVAGLTVYPAETLLQVCGHLSGKDPLAAQPAARYEAFASDEPAAFDLKYVKGQPAGRKALEIAAAGGHNLLMTGIPGSGKTMLARCLPGILPPMTYEEALETTLIHSAAGELGEDHGLMTQRPFRTPHHNVSMPAMIGGGAKARPGEVSLAHNGVLFLDELPEFRRETLEALRQPLEDGFVSVTRVGGQNRYQSHAALVAAMNPCPCGYHGDPRHACTCRPEQRARYRARLSGPLLDRIDVHVEVPAVPYEDLRSEQPGESSADMAQRVSAARQRQQARFAGTPVRCNAGLSGALLERHCAPDAEGDALLRAAVRGLGLSARAYTRILRLARTIADLDDSPGLRGEHMAEAISLRVLDRPAD